MNNQALALRIVGGSLLQYRLLRYRDARGGVLGQAGCSEEWGPFWSAFALPNGRGRRLAGLL